LNPQPASKRHRVVFRAAAPVIGLFLFGLINGFSQDSSSPERNAVNPGEAVDRAIASEKVLLERLRKLRPVVETYIQEEQPDAERGFKPIKDHYFLGRLDLSHGVNEDSYIPSQGFRKRLQSMKLLSWNLNMRGWAQLALVDEDSFDKSHYQFLYVKREFLGDVRCLVFDVKPKPDAGNGRFLGRMWIEDEGFHVVRFNGTYVPQAHRNGFVHFDSWRVASPGNVWVPGYVFAEERALPAGYGLKKIAFKAQIRYWGYNLKPGSGGEYTSLSIDAENGAKDVSDNTLDNSPVASSRLWEREEEDKVLYRLQQAGFLAPPGPVDGVLETVLSNVEVTNNISLDPSVRVRILLTTPLESFTVGHTIVISRGLIDVLPDEACLAAVISHELAHIALGHQLDPKYGFSDRLLFDDDQTLKKVNFARAAQDESEADAKAIEYLRKSSYAGKLDQVGLFLRELSALSKDLPNLIRPLLGNQMVETGKDMRLSGLMDTAPQLRAGNLLQISALPLGSRLKMDVWSGQLTLAKTQKLSLQFPSEKLALELTPFMLHLTHESSALQASPAASLPSDTPSTSAPN
jgi:hypothetical protein